MGKTSRSKGLSSLRYSKKIVTFSISFIVLFTIVSMFLNYRIGVELNPTLTSCVYTFFGTELAACMIIKVIETLRQKELKEEEQAEQKRQRIE